MKKLLLTLLLCFPLAASASTQIIGGIVGNVSGATFTTAITGLASSNSGRVTSVMPFGGTLTKLYVSINNPPSAGNSWTFNVTKDNGATIMTCTVDSTTVAVNGEYPCQDTSDTLTFIAGNDIFFKIVKNGTPNSTKVAWTVTMTPTNANDTVITSGQNAASSQTLERWLDPNAFISSAQTTEALAEQVFAEGGTLDEFMASSSVVISAGQYTEGVTTNAATTSLQCVFSSGYGCTDNSHTVTISAQDTFSGWVLPASTPTANAVGNQAMRFTPTTAGDFDFFMSSGAGSDSAGNTRYTSINAQGTFNAISVEASTTIPANTAFTLTKMYVLRSASPGAHNAKVVVRDNGADTAATCTMNGTTSCSWSGTLSVAAGDLIDYSVTLDTGGTTGSYDIGLVGTQVTASAATPPFLNAWWWALLEQFYHQL